MYEELGDRSGMALALINLWAVADRGKGGPKGGLRTRRSRKSARYLPVGRDVMRR
jgi:hypothetical protein